jgi:hypothetical protein
MASQEWIDANDIGYNYLKPNAFRMNFHNIPKVSYFCQTATIPGVSLGSAVQPNRYLDVPIVGDKLVYDHLQIRFIVDDQLKNWQELITWIEGIGFPDSNSQFNDLRKSGAQKTLSTQLTEFNEESGVYADATLTILTAKNNPYMMFTFEDLYPIAVSSIDFESTIGDIQYATASATFAYKGSSFVLL